VTDDRLNDVVYGFETRLKDRLTTDPTLLEDLVRFDPHEGRFDDPVMLGQQAADMLLASTVWSRAVGPVYDTTHVAQMLGVTRQAIAERVNSGSLLALHGRRSRMYPTWQFESFGDTFEVVEIVGWLLSTWRALEPEVEPLTIAVWANSPSEWLGGDTPAARIAEHDKAVVEAAEATARQRTR
jgi:hypothetical protein